MNIALDYDNTYTLDPIGWQENMEILVERGHKVYLVTSRHYKEDKLPFGDALMISQFVVELVYCDGKSKRQVCNDRGIKIDVWIDDHPETIVEDSKYTEADLQRWRKNGRQGKFSPGLEG